eukprot:g19868.t1
MEKGFLALTKQLNPSDVFKSAESANEWEVHRLKAAVTDLEQKLSDARSVMIQSPATSPKRERKEQMLHDEIKRLREELKTYSSEQSELRGGGLGGSGGVMSEQTRQLHDANLQLKVELEAAESRVQELEERTRRLELQAGDAGGDRSPKTRDVSLLQQQCKYLETSVLELERERARLLVRATSAEEELAEVQKQMQTMILDYERRLNGGGGGG